LNTLFKFFSSGLETKLRRISAFIGTYRSLAYQTHIPV
jgi:hypothetical protein